MFVILIRMIHMERKERQLKQPTFLYQRETRVKYPLESYIFTKKKKVDKKQNKINKPKSCCQVCYLLQCVCDVALLAHSMHLRFDVGKSIVQTYTNSLD